MTTTYVIAYTQYLLVRILLFNDNALQRKAKRQGLCLLAAILAKTHVQMLQEGKKNHYSIKKVYQRVNYCNSSRIRRDIVPPLLLIIIIPWSMNYIFFLLSFY